MLAAQESAAPVRRVGHRFVWLILAGFAFGLLVAAIKGQDPGVRDALGNTSAPWVLVPFFAGTRYPQVWRATLAGVAMMLAAFFGFYLAEAAILDLGAHPWYTDLQLTLGSGHVYEVWGIFSGVVYGALGGLWASRSLVVAPLAVALAFVCEPLIVFYLSHSGIWGGGLLHYHWLWVSEVIIGLAGIALTSKAWASRAVS
jgi:hypothetical protein